VAVRWELFQRMLGISHRPTYVLHGGVDGPNPWGFAIANPGADDAFRDYVGWFAADDTFATGSDLFRPWIWLGLGLVAAGVLLVPRGVRGRPGAIEVGLLTVGAVVYEGTFAVVAMGESFRYSYPAIVVALVAIMFAAATLITRRPPLSTADGEVEAAGPDPAPGGSGTDNHGAGPPRQEATHRGTRGTAVDESAAESTPSKS
jgi:hypothetical protein